MSRHRTVDHKSILVRCTCVTIPETLTHTWPVPELTPVRHQPVTPGASMQSVHQSHRKQSQGPPSCPTSQLRYWHPKGLPVPPITRGILSRHHPLHSSLVWRPRLHL